MYSLDFKNKGEIRMGSPYNLADVRLSGEFVPDFRGCEFQDKGSVNQTGDAVALVQWAIENNSPGVIVWMISEKDRLLKKSRRLSGCCEGIRFLNDGSLELTVSDNVRRKYVLSIDMNILSEHECP